MKSGQIANYGAKMPSPLPAASPEADAVVFRLPPSPQAPGLRRR
jgi:hypothetical protein